jgi:hypothetical protein
MSVASSSATAPRITAADLKGRLASGDPATILDIRSHKSRGASELRIRGDVRVSPKQFEIDPTWPKDRLTVVY